MSSLIENPIGMNTDLFSVEQKSLVALHERLTFLKYLSKCKQQGSEILSRVPYSSILKLFVF